jgi:hypothetical protein
MWSVFESDDSEVRRSILTFSVGASAGLALGILLSRRSRQAVAGVSGELRDRFGASGYTPSGISDAVADPQLTGLEDAVLDAFLSDPVLSERAIDVGAISRGIVELSGSVYTEDEAERAVRVANGVNGVQTVVNRIEVEEEAEQLQGTLRRKENGDPAFHETRWEGRTVGMGRMRQGPQTEPDRPDDSQHRRERALAEADRDQWLEEAVGDDEEALAARGETEPDFDVDELDHQDPRRAAAPDADRPLRAESDVEPRQDDQV